LIEAGRHHIVFRKSYGVIATCYTQDKRKTHRFVSFTYFVETNIYLISQSAWLYLFWTNVVLFCPVFGA
jgi:hypothetical protein